MLVGRSLHVRTAGQGSCGASAVACLLCGCQPPPETLIYLSPAGGGWVDNELIAGGPPRPADMSMILGWRALAPSSVCFWASPTIGSMQSFAPPFEECMHVTRPAAFPDSLSAVVTLDGTSRTGWLQILPGSAFPPSSIDTYLEQVRVLYGGRIPQWTHP